MSEQEIKIEICSLCNREKPIYLERKNEETKDLLCYDCGGTFCESNERWPPQLPPEPKPYFGPFPQQTCRKKNR